jgi:hypothetical protein
MTELDDLPVDPQERPVPEGQSRPVIESLAADTLHILKIRERPLVEAHVQELLDVLEADKRLPPVSAIREGADIHVFDGAHRCEAFRRLGQRIPVSICPGSLQDAELLAAASNQAHGLNRTNDDKRRAIRETLRLQPDWSSRRVAKHVGVGHQLVEDVRGGQRAPGQRRQGRDGRVRRVPIAKEPPAAKLNGAPMPAGRDGVVAKNVNASQPDELVRFDRHDEKHMEQIPTAAPVPGNLEALTAQLDQVYDCIERHCAVDKQQVHAAWLDFRTAIDGLLGLDTTFLGSAGVIRDDTHPSLAPPAPLQSPTTR